MSEALLAVAMRPRCFDDFVGQEKNIAALREQVKKSGIPHTFILVGAPGTGKTTMARIIAASILHQHECEFGSPNIEFLTELESGVMDYIEMNAGVNGGVDDIRELVDSMAHVPMVGNSSKIATMDEAQRLTANAKDALLKPIEEPPPHAYWIFATSNASKLDAAFRRRAYIINMGSSITREHLHELLKKAAIHRSTKPTAGQLTEFLDALEEVGISAPGVVLQCAERWFNGLDPRSAVTFAEESKIDAFAVAQRVAKGDWVEVCKVLCDDQGKLIVTKEDCITIRIVVTSYLRSMMIKGNKPVRCARAIGVLTSLNSYVDALELSATLGALCGACQLMVS